MTEPERQISLAALAAHEAAIDAHFKQRAAAQARIRRERAACDMTAWRRAMAIALAVALVVLVVAVVAK